MISCTFFRNVTVAFDEMKVREDLVFDRSGTVIGFTDTGDINNKLRSLEQCCKGAEQDEIATHMLTLMVLGIFFRLQFPYAQFPTTGAYIQCNDLVAFMYIIYNRCVGP